MRMSCVCRGGLLTRGVGVVGGGAMCAQSTYCHEIQEHCATVGRTVHVVNLVRCQPTLLEPPYSSRVTIPSKP